MPPNIRSTPLMIQNSQSPLERSDNDDIITTARNDITKNGRSNENHPEIVKINTEDDSNSTFLNDIVGSDKNLRAKYFYKEPIFIAGLGAAILAISTLVVGTIIIRCGFVLEF